MKKGRELFDIFLRYLILVVVAIPGLWLFYTIFTPITVYPVYWLLGIFFNVILSKSIDYTITFLPQALPIDLISACIAGSAYYLLLILNLSTPNVKSRIKALVFAFSLFLIVNILRIFFLSILALNGSPFFDITHKVFWYLLSTVFVVGIWFLEVKVFKIKGIPFISDLKFLYKNSKLK